MEWTSRSLVQVGLSSDSADSRSLLDACEAIKWPSKVHYTSLTTDERRRFERAYSDLLYLQTE